MRKKEAGALFAGWVRRYQDSEESLDRLVSKILGRKATITYVEGGDSGVWLTCQGTLRWLDSQGGPDAIYDKLVAALRERGEI